MARETQTERLVQYTRAHGIVRPRDLARLHGGDVTLERAEAGARFKVTLVTREARRE
jgi:hypothetical protein